MVLFSGAATSTTSRTRSRSATATSSPSASNATISFPASTKLHARLAKGLRTCSSTSPGSWWDRTGKKRELKVGLCCDFPEFSPLRKMRRLRRLSSKFAFFFYKHDLMKTSIFAGRGSSFKRWRKAVSGWNAGSRLKNRVLATAARDCSWSREVLVTLTPLSLSILFLSSLKSGIPIKKHFPMVFFLLILEI